MKDTRVFGFVAKSPYYGKKGAGYFNGYVAVRKDVVNACIELFQPSAGEDSIWAGDWEFPVYVHGGVSYTEGWHRQFFFMPVTELPSVESMKDYIIFGWDYAHCDDTWEKYPFSVVEEEVKETVTALLDVIDEYQGRE